MPGVSRDYIRIDYVPWVYGRNKWVAMVALNHNTYHHAADSPEAAVKLLREYLRAVGLGKANIPAWAIAFIVGDNTTNKPPEKS